MSREGKPSVSLGADADEFEGATWERSCPRCGRFVRGDAEIVLDWRGQPQGDNATCSRCGRVEMPWLGYP